MSGALLGVGRFRFHIHIKMLPNILFMKRVTQAAFGSLIDLGVCFSGDLN